MNFCAYSVLCIVIINWFFALLYLYCIIIIIIIIIVIIISLYLCVNYFFFLLILNSLIHWYDVNILEKKNEKWYKK